MSPSSHEINGPRPAPLKIHKDSHQIQKPPTSTAPPPRHQPVIIYTHSPKVIYTQARDFLALVQKLTGLSRSPKADEHPQNHEEKTEDKDSKEANVELGFDAETCVPDWFLCDIPQFAAHPSDQFFCNSAKNLYRF